jgi:hypothetical protein
MSECKQGLRTHYYVWFAKVCLFCQSDGRRNDICCPVLFVPQVSNGSGFVHRRCVVVKEFKLVVWIGPYCEMEGMCCHYDFHLIVHALAHVSMLHRSQRPLTVSCALEDSPILIPHRDICYANDHD